MQRVLLRSLIVIITSLSFAVAAAVPATAKATVKATIVKAQFGSTATRVASGAAVRVRVTYTCSPNQYVQLNVSVTQAASGGRIAQGFAAPEVNCDGKKHSMRFAVIANGLGGSAFRRGAAYLEGSLDSCNAELTCTSASTSKVIRIK